MDIRVKILLVVSGFVAGVYVSKASADTESVKPVRPKTGLMSTSIRGPERATVVDTGEETAQGGKFNGPPIAGSVSKISPREWKMVVANNTTDPYSVDVTVRQVNGRGDAVKNDHFSYTLKAGEQQTRNVSGAINAVDGKLILNSWKNLAPKKPAAKKEAAAGAAPDGAPAATVK